MFKSPLLISFRILLTPLVVFCLLAPILACYGQDTVSSNKLWQKTGDMTIRTENAFWPSALSPSITLFKPNLSKYKIRVRTAKEFDKITTSAQEIARKSGSLFVINGSFFDLQERPLGLVVSRGIAVSPLHKGGTTLTGIFQIKNGKPEIIHRDSFIPDGVVEAIQAGPRLLVDGKRTPITKDTSRSLRTAVCLDQDSQVVFASSTRWLLGVTLQEMQNVLGKVGCKNALNLDGGGSAQFVFSPSSVTDRRELLGKDHVPIFIEVLRK